MTKEHVSLIHSILGDNNEQRRKIFHSIKARSAAKRSRVEKIADTMTDLFGSINFLLFNLCLFIVWILINTGNIKSIPIFDPFPFNFLTMIVSLEAIVLAIFVLISQNRSAKVDDLREETHLQLNLISEREITKIMKMIIILLEKQGVDLSNDPEIKRMIKPVHEEEIEKRLAKEIL